MSDQSRFEIVQQFNNEIDSFLEFLKILAPINMKSEIVKIEMFKHANKISPIEYFVMYVMPYKKYIENNNFEYFLNKNLIEDTFSKEGKDFRLIEEIIKSVWVKMNVANKERCIKHLKRLMENTLEYVACLIDSSEIAFDILSGVLDLDFVNHQTKYGIMSSILGRKFTEANNMIVRELITHSK